MADETLRLPDTPFKAVFDLGPLLAAKFPLPEALAAPVLFAEWGDEDADELECHLTVTYPEAELHVENIRGASEFHFHGTSHPDKSPWGQGDTDSLVNWALALVANFMLMPDLVDNVIEAAEWFHEGLPIYVPETEPVRLELIELTISGEIFMLPWLGSGHVDHHDVEGENHLVELVWSPEHDEPTTAIARAWRDPVTGNPVTEPHPDTDWGQVALTREETLHWFEQLYTNHHMDNAAEDQIMNAVLSRMGGLS
jgi:hypothetical protein